LLLSNLDSYTFQKCLNTTRNTGLIFLSL